ncbi:alpha/beta hydrolase [Actinorhabdospora filicis]|uniref:Alpha/beta hydrolase n=1 Tax=Actinorhabdospora filicis TaxID=1785913 RepID=A0A9W6SMD6_9ACTN|nr:alpha/beta hydrolase [Actinorhabdospora filicis]GLZ78459.1 alpha/beta hydrolase [Actinorhabdospora filicis]
MSPQPTGYAHNGDVRIAYDDLGGSGGEPLLLVMGTGLTRLWWPLGFAGELIGRGFHVVSYDNRDSGQSTRFPAAKANPVISQFRKRAPAYAAEDMADDAAAVMDAVGWERAHLFGHSMGGLIAQRVAMRHPDRILSLTTSAAVPSDASRLKLLSYIRFGFVAKLSRMRFPETPEGDIAFGMAFLRAVASPGYPFDEQDALSRVKRDDSNPLRDNAAQGRQLGAKWSGGRLAQLRVPAVVMHGEADPLLRTSAARALSKAIPGARLVTSPGVGHDLPQGVWPAYADQVRSVADAATGSTR